MTRKYRRSHRKPCSPGNKKREQDAQRSCYVFMPTLSLSSSFSNSCRWQHDKTGFVRIIKIEIVGFAGSLLTMGEMAGVCKCLATREVLRELALIPIQLAQQQSGNYRIPTGLLPRNPAKTSESLRLLAKAADKGKITLNPEENRLFGVSSGYFRNAEVESSTLLRST